MSSFKVDVQVRDSAMWYSNGLRFTTEASAAAYAQDMLGRWLLIERVRVGESTDPPNRDMVNGELITL